MRFPFLNLLLCTCFLSQADTARADELLTMEDATRRALERAPRLQLARAQRDVASAYGTMGRQTRVRNPLVAVRAMVGVPDGPAATYSVSLGLPFDLSARRTVWRREAELLLARAEAELVAAENDARAEARRAYLEAAIAEHIVVVQEERASIIEGILGRARAQLDAAATTAYDVALAERELGQARADALAARTALEQARGALRQALDLDPDASLVVALPDVPAVEPELSAEGAAARAVEARREPLAARLAADRARASDRRLRADVVDPVFVGLDVEAQGNQRTQSSVGASVGFNLPVLFRNAGERAIARATADALDVEASVLERTVAREAATNRNVLVARVAELAAIDEHALPAADRAATMTESRLAAGAVDLFQVLANRRDLFALRAHRLEVLREAWLARIALDRAIGERTEVTR